MDDDVREKYLKAGRIAAEVRETASSKIKEDALLLDVAEFAESEIIRLGGKLAFPVNLSIDNAAAHYTPHSGDKSRFKAGNLVKIDLGAHVDGYIADTALTVEVSTNDWQELISAPILALDMVLNSIRPDIPVRDIGTMIEQLIGSKGFLPISNLSGHTLENCNLHAGVSVPNVKDWSTDTLPLGTAVAIEPFATNGAGRVSGRKGGNIYRQIRNKSLSDPDLNALLDKIKMEFHGLPFSERWVARQVKDSDRKLRKLMRQGAVASYPVLKDVKGGMVSQAEHTLIVTADGCIVTTR